MRKFITKPVAARHTDLIGIGHSFSENIRDPKEISKMLKQTARIFEKSEFTFLFDGVKPGKYITDTMFNYLEAIKKFNEKNDNVHLSIEHNKNITGKWEYCVSLRSWPIESDKLYHMHVDFVPILIEQYPEAGELYRNCLNILLEKYDLGDGHYVTDEYLAEEIYNMLDDTESYGIDKTEAKRMQKTLDHYEKYARLIYNNKADLSVRFLEDIKNFIPGPKQRKLFPLFKWFGMFYDLVQSCPYQSLSDIHERGIIEVEAFNDCSYEDLCENGSPVPIQDILAMTWFGSESITSSTVDMINNYTGEFGSMPTSDVITVTSNSKNNLPLELLTGNTYNFLSKLSKMIILNNDIRDTFIKGKYKFLE